MTLAVCQQMFRCDSNPVSTPVAGLPRPPHIGILHDDGSDKGRSKID